MITFPCKCGQILEVPDDQAGLTAQCPTCGLLRDVPTLSDLSHLVSDGTYDLEPSNETTEEHRIEELRLAFSKEHTDDDGEEIDLRPTMSDVKRAGYIEEPVDDSAPLIPKYDPVTGELVEPIKVGGIDLASSHIPLAKRSLGYATRQNQSVHHSAAKIFLELLQPVNMVVMTFILIGHLIWEVLFTLVSIPYFFMLAVLFFALTVMFFAHYALVIEEIGVEARDELPRPLRQFEFLPDLFWPFMHFIGALFLCFAPGFIALNNLHASPWQWPAFDLLTLAGFIFFPAILLTLTTSGTARNIRPDRLIGVIRHSGLRYFVAVLLFPVISAIYILGIISVDHVSQRAFHQLPAQHSWMTSSAIAFPLLIIGIYIMHYFCWYLGLIYRDFHDSFPWIFQRHIPTRLLERTRT